MPTYDADRLRAFYDNYGAKEWARWDRDAVQRIKFEVHLHYLREYLRPSDRVLEIGAGPGRFTLELARLAARIVVGDISPVQLELNRANAEAMGFAGVVERWVECDVCDLATRFAEGEFDAVVCYGGPLSYVFEQRSRALAEMLRVIRPGGVLFVSVMSLWGTAHQGLPGVLAADWAENRRIIATGDLDPTTPGVATHHCHMYRAAELRDMREEGGASVEVISASNCLTATWPEKLESVREDSRAWDELLQVELEACRKPGCADMGSHLIAVCSKPR